MSSGTQSTSELRDTVTAVMPPAIDWSSFDPEQVDPTVLSVVRCTFLLESRSSSYGSYLRSVLPASTHPVIDRWESDEEHHGRALRRWLGRADPLFDAEAALQRFRRTPYHSEPGGDRGGPSRELAARCMVEALASGFYLGLGESVGEPLLREICFRLRDDERRHHGQFLELMGQTARLSTGGRLVAMLRRALELEDEQISAAAEIANGGICGSGVARSQHFRAVYRLFGRQQIEYVLALTWDASGYHPPAALDRALRCVVEAGLRLRTWSFSIRLQYQHLRRRTVGSRQGHAGC